MASSLLRSAGCALRRSVATSPRRSARSLIDNPRAFSSGASGWTQKNELSGSKLNMERIKDTQEVNKTHQSFQSRIEMNLDKMIFTQEENARLAGEILVGLQKYKERVDRDKEQRKALFRLCVLLALAYGAKQTLFS